jgi:hypothetical protein
MLFGVMFCWLFGSLRYVCMLVEAMYVVWCDVLLVGWLVEVCMYVGGGNVCCLV